MTRLRSFLPTAAALLASALPLAACYSPTGDFDSKIPGAHGYIYWRTSSKNKSISPPAGAQEKAFPIGPRVDAYVMDGDVLLVAFRPLRTVSGPEQKDFDKYDEHCRYLAVNTLTHERHELSAPPRPGIDCKPEYEVRRFGTTGLEYIQVGGNHKYIVHAPTGKVIVEDRVDSVAGAEAEGKVYLTRRARKKIVDPAAPQRVLRDTVSAECNYFTIDVHTLAVTQVDYPGNFVGDCQPLTFDDLKP